MKKFSFPLERVLSWRQAQVRLAEATLSRLNVELQTLDGRIAALGQALLDSRASLFSAASTSPAELGAMEHFRDSVSAQTRFLAQSRRTLEQTIAQQRQTVLERRRDAQLLEKLRDTGWQQWRRAADQETDRLAEESFLARLTAERSPRFQ